MVTSTLVSRRMGVQSLASLNGLQIRSCCELWCRPAAVSSSSTPSLGTSICHRCSPKKQNKQTDKNSFIQIIPSQGYPVRPSVAWDGLVAWKRSWHLPRCALGRLGALSRAVPQGAIGTEEIIQDMVLIMVCSKCTEGKISTQMYCCAHVLKGFCLERLIQNFFKRKKKVFSFFPLPSLTTHFPKHVLLTQSQQDVTGWSLGS